VNSGDCTLYCSRLFSLTPSTIATIATIEFTSLPATAHARNADSVVRDGSSTVEHSLMATGSKMALPAGIVQVRSPGPEVVCTRNHTSLEG